jgi:hypothetical protein
MWAQWEDSKNRFLGGKWTKRGEKAEKELKKIHKSDKSTLFCQISLLSAEKPVKNPLNFCSKIY